MHIKQGFTLIEWLVSFCITILLVTLVFQFLANFYTAYVQRATHNSIFAQNVVALDHLSRNVSHAPAQKKLWHTFNDTHILWHDEQNNRNIGYLFEKHNIYFLVQAKHNNKHNKKRSKKIRKNLLASHIKRVTFTPIEKQGIMQAIRCSITFGLEENTCCFDRIVSLQNKVLA